MRVIAGTARSIPLITAPGNNTRPTTDRIKETLFNMIGPDIAGSTFLDLFSGSGGIGIEALSRGAARAVFVEADRRAYACINKNLEKTRLSERAEVIRGDVRASIATMRAKEPFDYVFLDPPYQSDLAYSALEALAQSSLIDAGTTVILETDLDASFEPFGELEFLLDRDKIYKTNRHFFMHLERRG